eukprot:symbB.v1.2.002262.t1/scaffold92.1/size545918/19
MVVPQPPSWLSHEVMRNAGLVLLKMMQTWHGALVPRPRPKSAGERPWRDCVPEVVASASALSVQPTSGPRSREAAEPLNEKIASMASVVASSHQPMRLKATWKAPQGAVPPSQAQLLPQRAGAGYKSAMQLLQEAQPAAGRAAGRAGHKSALELLREVTSLGAQSRPWPRRSRGRRRSKRPRVSKAVKAPRLPVIEHYYIHKHIHRHHMQVIGGEHEAHLAAERMRSCTETPELPQRTLLPHRAQGLRNSTSLPSL